MPNNHGKLNYYELLSDVYKCMKIAVVECVRWMKPVGEMAVGSMQRFGTNLAVTDKYKRMINRQSR